MEEEYYNKILLNYRSGVEFILKTDRGNGIIENKVRLIYSGKKPQLKFINGGAIFNPESVGGVEKIISLDEINS